MAYPNPFASRLTPQLMQQMQLGQGGAQIQQRPSGFREMLSRPGVQQALLHTGLGLLAQSDTPGSSLAGNLGRAMPVGLEMGRIAEEEDKARKERQAQQAAYRNALEDAPLEMRNALRMLGPDQGMMLLAQHMLTPPKRDIREVDDSLVEVTDQGVDTLWSAPTEPDVPSDVLSYNAYRDMSPDDQAGFLDYLKSKTMSTTVNVGQPPNPVQQAVATQRATLITDGFGQAQASTDKVAMIDRLSALTETEGFDRVSGPAAGRFGALRARVAGDVEALEAIAQFSAEGGMMTMAQLEAFTGPKTDFEYQQAQRLVFNDPTMTPTEIRAGLGRLREVAQQEAVRWADRMLQLDPAAPGMQFSPADVAPQMELARQIRARFGTPSAAADLRLKYGLN